MRAFLAFLLCFAIAFQGTASAYVFEQPCPMELGMQAGMDMPDCADECCNDADTAARTGKLCKAGQSCNLPALGAIALPAARPLLAATCFVTTAPQVILSGDPASVWRPPTLS